MKKAKVEKAIDFASGYESKGDSSSGLESGDNPTPEVKFLKVELLKELQNLISLQLLDKILNGVISHRKAFVCSVFWSWTSLASEE